MEESVSKNEINEEAKTRQKTEDSPLSKGCVRK